MSIPSIEELLAYTDKIRRHRDNLLDAQESSLRTIVQLTAERDRAVDQMKAGWIRVTNTSIGEFVAENHALKSALHEAKEALVATGSDLDRVWEAITTINTVFKEE